MKCLGLPVADSEAVLDDLLLPGVQDPQEVADLLPHQQPVHAQFWGLNVGVLCDLLQQCRSFFFFSNISTVLDILDQVEE